MINAIISLGVIISSIIAGAVGDALNYKPDKVVEPVEEDIEIKKPSWFRYTFLDANNKIWGHRLKALEIGILVASPFIIPADITSWFAYIASYALIRGSLFDPIFNKVRGNKITYNGSSSTWDRFFEKMPGFGKWIWMVLLLIAGVGVAILEL